MKFIATLLVTVLILVAVLLPGSKIPDVGFTGIDKLAHITLFFLWSLAIRFDFNKNFKWWLGFLSGLLFSYGTEVLQILVEGRTYDYYDVLADTVGLIIGLSTGGFILSLVIKYWPFRKD